MAKKKKKITKKVTTDFLGSIPVEPIQISETPTIVKPKIQIAWDMYNAGAGTLTAYTVPAGYNLFITSAYVGGYKTADTGTYVAQLIATPGGKAINLIEAVVSSFEKSHDNNSTTFSALPVKIEAGNTIYLNTGTNLVVRGGFFGWLEPVL